MARKQISYSSIRRHFNLDKKDKEDNSVAFFTHYIQTLGSKAEKYFIEDARLYAQTLLAGDFNLKLDFDFDVPFPPVHCPEFTFIDLFAGIGGFRIALQELKGKCVFSSEWDKFAKKTYEANFGEVPFGDITKIDADIIPDHDILVGGFPCQPFSIAGVSKKNALGRSHGFLDKTQGTLFFDIARIIEEKRPRAFLLENVKNLVSHNKGNTFTVIKNTLSELGYSVFFQVVNAKYFVPQHRERIFIVGLNKDIFGNDTYYKFPAVPERNTSFSDILDPDPDPKYILTDHLWNYLIKYAKKHKAKGNGFGYGLTDMHGISRTLSARYYKDGSEILVSQGQNANPRRLTPEECKNLMGFPEEFIINNIGVSDTQLYKQFGNSVVVPVVRHVASPLVKLLIQHTKKQVIYQAV